MTTPRARDQQRLRWASTAALATNVLIVFSGGLVRVTGSGLGCPTWPRCDEESFVPTPGGRPRGLADGDRVRQPDADLRGARGRRGGGVGAAAPPGGPPASLLRLAWLLPAGVLAQAVMGGITVLLGLTPWTVAMHFLLSMVLIAVAVVVFEWVRRPPDAALPGAGLRWATWALAAVGFVVLVLGTLVTGAGPTPATRPPRGSRPTSGSWPCSTPTRCGCSSA
jgi:heme a synthase